MAGYTNSFSQNQYRGTLAEFNAEWYVADVVQEAASAH